MVSGFLSGRPGDSDGLASGVHFDVLVGDLDDAQRRVIAAGGTVAGEQFRPVQALVARWCDGVYAEIPRAIRSAS